MTEPVDVVRHASVRLDVTREVSYRGDIPGTLKRLGLADLAQEAIWVIAYDAHLHVRTIVEVSRGSFAKADLHIPSVLTAALLAGSDRFDIAHNHPSGSLRPTKSDIEMTMAVMNAANACGMWFEDHWIVTPKGEYTSFRKNGWIVPLPYTGEAKA